MRKKILRTLVAVAVAGVLAGAAAVWYHVDHDGSYLGGSASRVARSLGCQHYSVQKLRSRLAQFHDQGTCALGGNTVQVTTFSSSGEQQAYMILMNTLTPVYLKHGGAYAAGDGWVVADDVDLSKAVAVTVSQRLGGSVREFSAVAAGASAAPSPSTS